MIIFFSRYRYIHQYLSYLGASICSSILLQPGAKAKDLLAGTKLVSERGFAGRSSDSADELDPVWTPEGDAIVFIASTNRDQAAYAQTNTSLFKVAANGGEVLLVDVLSGFSTTSVVSRIKERRYDR